MHVFVTGATGWVGSAVIDELRAAGHDVSGLARSDEAAAALAGAGIAVVRGSLEESQALRAAARSADAVVHTAFNHDFSRFAENGAVETAAIDALADGLAETGRPLVITSGIGLVRPGTVTTEDDVRDPFVSLPRDPEAAAARAAARGIRVSVVRLPPSVHGAGDRGFIARVIAAAREHGVSGYAGRGDNRWSAVHRRDAARLYRLALERSANYGIYHAVAEDGVAFREIAAVIGRRLELPVAALDGDAIEAHFGWFARFAQMDAPASSAITRTLLGWTSGEPGLLEEIAGDAYVSAAHAR